MDGPAQPESTIELDPRHAVDLIIDTVMAHEPGTVTLVPTAGLTNIAMAARKEPRIVERVKEVVLMGGGYHVGNWSAVAEFNIIIDPEAAHIVFNEKWPVVMVGLDLTHQALATPEVVETDRGRRHQAGQVRHGTDGVLHQDLQGRPGLRLPARPRSCAVAYVIDPSIITTRKVPVDIELQGKLTLGMTVADFRAPAPEDCHTSVAVDLDHKRFWDLVTDALVRIGEPAPRRSNRRGQVHESPPSPTAKPPGNVTALMVALLAACVAFQLNASMLSPAWSPWATSSTPTRPPSACPRPGSSPPPPCSPSSCPASATSSAARRSCSA